MKDRWMDEEVVVHIYNGILFSHKKEWIWVSYSEVDEPRTCYTEWSRSEREKQILYSNTYMWNLERWHWWTHLQGGKGDTDTENEPVDTVREWEGGTDAEQHQHVHTTTCKVEAGEKLRYNSKPSVVLSDDLGWGRRGRFKREMINV